MSTDAAEPSVTLAEARAAEARKKLVETVGTLQTRLDPRIVAREAVDGLTATGEKALRSGVETLRTGVDTARAYPSAITTGLTLVIAVLARRRIANLFTRRTSAKKDAATARALARSIPGDWPATAERNEI